MGPCPNVRGRGNAEFGGSRPPSGLSLVGSVAPPLVARGRPVFCSCLEGPEAGGVGCFLLSGACAGYPVLGVSCLIPFFAP